MTRLPSSVSSVRRCSSRWRWVLVAWVPWPANSTSKSPGKLGVNPCHRPRACSVNTLQSWPRQTGSPNDGEEPPLESALSSRVHQCVDQRRPVPRIHRQAVDDPPSEADFADQPHSKCRVDHVVDLRGRESEQTRVEDEALSRHAPEAIDRYDVVGQQRTLTGPDQIVPNPVSIVSEAPTVPPDHVRSRRGGAALPMTDQRSPRRDRGRRALRQVSSAKCVGLRQSRRCAGRAARSCLARAICSAASR